MRLKALGSVVAGIAAASLLAACGGGASADSATSAATEAAASPTTAGEVQTLTLGAVPSLDSLGLIEIARSQGYLAAGGIGIEYVPVDSGPSVVTGVVAGQYDLGSTAYAPPLLALAEGAPLVAVTNVGTVGPDGTNGGTLVRKDSGITSWKDLAGKKVASNAPRSLFSLTVPAAVAADGGDPSGIEIVPLPFNQIPKAVAEGQVDAGVALEPFLTGGLAEFPDLVNLGDSIHAVLPEGAGSGTIFTSVDTASAKADAIAAFQQAIGQAVDYANAHPDELKAAGAPLAGLTPEQASALPLSPLTTQVTEQDLQSLIDLMVEFGWVQTAPDLSAFLKQ